MWVQKGNWGSILAEVRFEARSVICLSSFKQFRYHKLYNNTLFTHYTMYNHLYTINCTRFKCETHGFLAYSQNFTVTNSKILGCFHPLKKLYSFSIGHSHHLLHPRRPLIPFCLWFCLLSLLMVPGTLWSPVPTFSDSHMAFWGLCISISFLFTAYKVSF